MLSGASTEDTLFIRTEWDICDPLRIKTNRKAEDAKKSIRLIKKEPFATERRIDIHPSSPFAADKLFIFILQKAKNLVLCVSFPFLPFFIPFSFSSPSYFHIRFPLSAFSSQYTQNYPHVIPLIHGISHSYPPYPQPYARFPETCPMPYVNI